MPLDATRPDVTILQTSIGVSADVATHYDPTAHPMDREYITTTTRYQYKNWTRPHVTRTAPTSDRAEAERRHWAIVERMQEETYC